jgi:hypothetical protein
LHAINHANIGKICPFWQYLLPSYCQVFLFSTMNFISHFQKKIQKNGENKMKTLNQIHLSFADIFMNFADWFNGKIGSFLWGWYND